MPFRAASLCGDSKYFNLLPYLDIGQTYGTLFYLLTGFHEHTRRQNPGNLDTSAVILKFEPAAVPLQQSKSHTKVHAPIDKVRVELLRLIFQMGHTVRSAHLNGLDRLSSRRTGRSSVGTGYWISVRIEHRAAEPSRKLLHRFSHQTMLHLIGLAVPLALIEARLLGKVQLPQSMSAHEIGGHRRAASRQCNRPGVDPDKTVSSKVFDRPGPTNPVLLLKNDKVRKRRGFSRFAARKEDLKNIFRDDSLLASSETTQPYNDTLFWMYDHDPDDYQDHGDYQCHDGIRFHFVCPKNLF